MTIDFDKYYLCPDCRVPMEVRVPISVIPGEVEVDVEEIDYESDLPSWSHNWYCPSCCENQFPLWDPVDPDDYVWPEET